MSVLVLGGAGYIGSHVVYELVSRGEEVMVVDNLETGYRGAVHEQARFYHGDIRDRRFLDAVFEQKQIEAVIHLAASSLVGESVMVPLKYYDNNLCGTKILLEAMIEHDVKKIVFSSTAAVYGEPVQPHVVESDRTEPTNAYGETKLAIEKMFKWTDRAHGLKYVSLRYFNAAGAHESGKIGEAHDPETHLIPLVLQVANKTRECVSIYGDDYNTRDGTCVRDYIHVKDLAEAHILALGYIVSGYDSDVVNLGNGKGFSVKEIIETVEQVTGKNINTAVAPRRAGDPATLVASAEKAKSVLGWVPKRDSIGEIIGSAWKWHSTHPNGFR